MTLDHLSSIPVCDFSHWKGKQQSALRERFLETWDYAFRTFGFLILINHGLEKKYHALNLELKRFFEHPLEKKLAFRLSKSYGLGGYTPQGQESVSKSHLKSEKRPPDAVESLVLSREIPESFPCISNGYENDHLKFQSLALQKDLDELTLNVMKIMADCLQLPENFFREFYTSSDSTKDLRCAHYLPGEDSKTGCLRYGEHTDYTGFTFLWRSEDNGLQCLAPGRKTTDPKENDWIDVTLIQGNRDALVINAGDLIQRWTNKYWISNVHRVAGPTFRLREKQTNLSNPLSIVYFTGPAGNTKIKMLSESKKVASTGEALAEYRDEVTAEEHLWRKINASNE